MDMLSLIEELDALLQRGIRVPGSGRLLVDEASARQILSQMRSAVPDEVRLGQRIAGERERILADARAHARRMVEEAQAQVSASLEENGIVQAAHERANEIIAEAEQKAASLQVQANQYTQAQLSSLESRLQRVLREIQAGQRFLTQNPDQEDAAKASQQF